MVHEMHDKKEASAISPLAGKPAPTSMIVDLGRLEREYYERKPDLDDPTQLVSFGTSGCWRCSTTRTPGHARPS